MAVDHGPTVTRYMFDHRQDPRSQKPVRRGPPKFSHNMSVRRKSAVPDDLAGTIQFQIEGRRTIYINADIQ